MRELHLFAGIGGGILAGKLLGHRCVGAVEINAYCRQVLEARQREGVIESFPILEDVCTFDGKPWRGKVDVVCGGFPCTPWSTAGKRLGTADPRHLWPEMARIISEVRPAYVFAENVSLAAFEQPWRDLRGMGYRVPPAIQVSAGDLGAPYRRNRWWLLAADTDLVRQPVRPGDAEVARTPEPCDAYLEGLAQRQGERGNACAQLETPVRTAWRITAPGLRRLLPGPAARLVSRKQRIHAAGNCQVPQVAADAFAWLMREHFAR